MKEKKPESAGKPRDVAYVRLKGKLRQWLYDERESRGGDDAGVTLPGLVREKLKKQMDAEKKPKK